MRHIRLLDGHIISASTYEEVEARYGATFMNAAIEPDKFRAEVAQRAKTWSNTDIAIDGSAADFLQECERAGLLQVVDGPETIEPRKVESVPRIVYLDHVRAAAEKRQAVKDARQAQKGS